jgi:hypothetical protein
MVETIISMVNYFVDAGRLITGILNGIAMHR